MVFDGRVKIYHFKVRSYSKYVFQYKTFWLPHHAFLFPPPGISTRPVPHNDNIDIRRAVIGSGGRVAPLCR